MTALDYIARGLKVVPLRPRGKEPLGRLAPHGWRSATGDAEVAARWWRAYPNANVGIACSLSGVAVLDVDPRHGGDDSLHDLEREFGTLPYTWRAITGGGGLHVYLRDPGVPLVGNVAAGVEVKGRHYVVAPPSATERAYEWEVEPGEVELAAIPAAWLERLREPVRPALPRQASEDPLLDVPPAVYVELLTGERIDRDGKVACPLHEERTPSCHVYDDPRRGWYCYGCKRGGTIYDFAGYLWGYPSPLRGPAFLAVQDRLLNAVLDFYERRVA